MSWVHSVLFVRGSHEDIVRFRAENSDPHGDGDLSFAGSVPMPEGVTDVREWRLENWGVGSDASESVSYEQRNKIEYSLHTLATFPATWLRKVADKYPTLEFQLDSMPQDLELAYRIMYLNNPDRVVRTYKNLKISNMYHDIYRNIFGESSPEGLEAGLET